MSVRKKVQVDKNTVKRAWIYLGLLGVLLVGLYVVTQRIESKEERIEPGTEVYVEPARTIEIGGREYEYDHKVRTYVFLGSDDSGNPEGIGEEYAGPMTDFIMVVVVDDKSKPAF